MMTEQGKIPPGDISDVANTNAGACLRISERPNIDWYEKRPRSFTRGHNNSSKQDRRKNAEQTLEVNALVVLKPVSKLFTETVNYCQYRLVKKSVRYEDAVAYKLSGMTRKISVEMKDRKFFRTELVLMISFLKYFKAGYAACDIHERDAVGLFKKLLIEPVKSFIKARMGLLTKTSRTQE